MYKIEEYINAKDYSTLSVGGTFRYFTIASSISDIIEVSKIAKEKGKKIFILGGGSNIVFTDGIIDLFVIKIEIKNFEIVSEDENHTDIKVGAGEIWDKIVEKTVEMNLSGFEALSAIPGTVGASPVQNIGAYGSEVKDTILEVEAFDIKKGYIITISNKDCKFGYRDSIFKNEAKGKYIITAVTYRLWKSKPTVPSYPGVFKYFEDKKIVNPTLRQICDAIIFIRSEKLPNPKEVPNVGSFFKNKIVSNKVADRIKNEFPDAKFFRIDSEFTKIPAGWLIEKVGLKGKSVGNISVYDKNALVLVNRDNATFEDIILARDQIIKIVEQKFGVTLEQEPEIV